MSTPKALRKQRLPHAEWTVEHVGPLKVDLVCPRLVCQISLLPPWPYIRTRTTHRTPHDTCSSHGGPYPPHRTWRPWPSSKPYAAFPVAGVKKPNVPLEPHGRLGARDLPVAWHPLKR